VPHNQVVTMINRRKLINKMPANGTALRASVTSTAVCRTEPHCCTHDLSPFPKSIFNCEGPQPPSFWISIADMTTQPPSFWISIADMTTLMTRASWLRQARKNPRRPETRDVDRLQTRLKRFAGVPVLS
jgi:hypothetical protein